MSNRSHIRRFLTIAFMLTGTSVALARRPPALLERQEGAERAFAACPVHLAQSGGGYRDMLVRFLTEDSPRLAKSAVAHVAVDQLAFACSVRLPVESGYRDMLVRFSPAPSNLQVARANR